MFRGTALAVLAFSGVAMAGEEHAPQQHLVASSHNTDVVAAPGSYCNERLCADYAYPLKLGDRVPVHAGGKVKLRFRAAPREVSANLRGKQSQHVRGLQATGSGKKWVVRLPDKLPKRMDRLGVFVQYDPGDSDFEVGLKRHSHR